MGKGHVATIYEVVKGVERRWFEKLGYEATSLSNPLRECLYATT